MLDNNSHSAGSYVCRDCTEGVLQYNTCARDVKTSTDLLRLHEYVVIYSSKLLGVFHYVCDR